MYHVTKYGQWETGHLSIVFFLLLDNASPTTHYCFTQSFETCTTPAHTCAPSMCSGRGGDNAQLCKTQNHKGTVSHLEAAFAQLPTTRRCTWHKDLPSFLKKQALCMLSCLGRAKRWATCSQNDYVRTAATTSTGLCKSVWGAVFCKWHAFTPKGRQGRKTCCNILILWDEHWNILWHESQEQHFNQVSCTAGMWATTSSILLLALSFCIRFNSQSSELCNTDYTCNLGSLLLHSPLLKITNISLCIFHICNLLAIPPFACGLCAKLHPKHAVNHSFPWQAWYSALLHVRLRASLHMKFSPK